MAQGGIRFVAVAGVLVMGGAALAGCGGSSGRRAAGAGGGGASSPTTVTTAPVPTVAPGSTVAPSSTLAPTTVAPTAAAPSTAVAPTTVPATTGPAAGGPVLIVGSFGGSVGYDGRRPSIIDFSSDSTNIVTHVVWSSWGPATAVGNGQLGLNNCQPNCAQGQVTQVPATVELSRVVGGHFTAMTERAASIFRSYSYPSDWALGAS